MPRGRPSVRTPPSVGRLLRPPSLRTPPWLPSTRLPPSRKSARLRIWLGTLPVRERIELPEREPSKLPLLEPSNLEPSLLMPERVPEKLLRLLLEKLLRLLGLELRLLLEKLLRLLGLELRLLLEKLLRLLELELRLELEKLEPLRLELEKPPPPRLTLELLLCPPPPPLRPPPPRWAYTGVSAKAAPNNARLIKRDIFMILLLSFFYLFSFLYRLGLQGDCRPVPFFTMQKYNHFFRKNPFCCPIFPV